MSNRRACGGAFVNIFQAYNVTQREIQAVFVDSQNLIRFLPRARYMLPKCDRRNLPVTGALDGEIRDSRHQMRVRVYFEDTDSGQIVYHASFLRFMERGRTDYLRLLGMNQQELLKEARRNVPGFAFVVRSMSIDSLKPAILDDLLEVITVPEDVRGASIILLQECRRGDDLFSHGPRARRLYLRRKGATYPEGAAAHHGRGVEKSTLVHAVALQRPNGIKQLISCCDIVKPEFPTNAKKSASFDSRRSSFSETIGQWFVHRGALMSSRDAFDELDNSDPRGTIRRARRIVDLTDIVSTCGLRRSRIPHKRLFGVALNSRGPARIEQNATCVNRSPV